MPALNTRHRQPIAALWYTALPAILVACIVLTLGIVFITSTALASANIAGFSALIMFVSVMGTILAIAYPILFYLLFSYEIGEHAITINSGIIFRQHETINFERIQVVDNERGPLLMLFGLTLVELWTSSPDQLAAAPHSIRPRPDATLLLKKGDAEELKDFVTRRPPQGTV
jgi:membrane protein YdbS with pleckstrin-like domain